MLQAPVSVQRGHTLTFTANLEDFVHLYRLFFPCCARKHVRTESLLIFKKESLIIWGFFYPIKWTGGGLNLLIISSSICTMCRFEHHAGHRSRLISRWDRRFLKWQRWILKRPRPRWKPWLVSAWVFLCEPGWNLFFYSITTIILPLQPEHAVMSPSPPGLGSLRLIWCNRTRIDDGRILIIRGAECALWSVSQRLPMIPVTVEVFYTHIGVWNVSQRGQGSFFRMMVSLWRRDAGAGDAKMMRMKDEGDAMRRHRCLITTRMWGMWNNDEPRPLDTVPGSSRSILPALSVVGSIPTVQCLKPLPPVSRMTLSWCLKYTRSLSTAMPPRLQVKVRIFRPSSAWVESTF